MNFFDITYCIQYFPRLLSYLPATLEIVAVTSLVGLALGFLLGVIRLARMPVLARLVVILVSFARSVPPNVLLLSCYFMLPALLGPAVQGLFGIDLNRMGSMQYVWIAYSIMNGAFFSELVRASVSGVDEGQVEAGLACGMTGTQTFRRIVLPQALRISLPELSNLLINIVKNTSLAYIIGVVDLMGAVSIVSATSFRNLEAYVDVALIYLVIAALIELMFRALKHRLTPYGGSSHA